MTIFDSAAGDLSGRLDALNKLSLNDEACRLLGTDGALESQLDLTFVDDPLDWLAYDISIAVRNADADEAGADEDPGPTLAALVAELRLYRVLAGQVDLQALARKVEEHLREET